MFALYADELTCRNDDPTTSWKVPRDTGIEIIIWFKTPPLLSELKIDLTKYERVPDKELRGLVYFYNYVDGVQLETTCSCNYLFSGRKRQSAAPSETLDVQLA